MDFLSNPHQFMLPGMGTAFLLLIAAIWADDHYGYWRGTAALHANRPHYQFSYNRARRISRGWLIAMCVFFLGAIGVTGYGLYLTLATPPVALVYY